MQNKCTIIDYVVEAKNTSIILNSKCIFFAADAFVRDGYTFTFIDECYSIFY